MANSKRSAIPTKQAECTAPYLSLSRSPSPSTLTHRARATNVIATQSATTLAGDPHVLQATKDVLDRWFFGVIILGADQRVLFVNKAAKDILSKGDGLRVSRHDGIRAVSSEENAKLREAVQLAIMAAEKRRTPFGSVMRISRSSAARSLIAFVTALVGQGMSAESAACVIFSDPELRADPDQGFLRSLFGLTGAEAKVAALLVQGYDARRIGERLAVSFNTARTHVKRVFEKTNTRRQSELVHLILCAPLSSRLKG